MRFLSIVFLLSICLSCKKEEAVLLSPITSVTIEKIATDTSSIRALEITNQDLVFAGSKGIYGYYPFDNKSVGNINLKNNGVINFLNGKPSFRAVASTTDYFYMLSIDQPALLYQYNKKTSEVKLVYIEDVQGVFYDAMAFWDDQEGIAMGDPTENCLSILKTVDGGNTWQKISCDVLPKVNAGEAAFAASDTNIKIIGNTTWIVSGGAKSRVFKSTDRGETWQVFKTPMIQGTASTGAYSMDFYNENQGILYGGDYTEPTYNTANIALTYDGGKSWQLVANGQNEGYKSCVQYVPNSNGEEIVALGFTGVSYSQDAGNSWNNISKEALLSFRFVNDSIAFAGGREGLYRLKFNRE